MSRTSLAARERAALCDLFEQTGPDAPTLCGQWTTRDLAAHLIVREHRPDATAGIVIKSIAGWGERIQAGEAARPWPDLIRTVRTGPPLLSAFRLPRMDTIWNTTEFFVHHEDVRRTSDGWSPRTLSAADSGALWKVVRTRGAGFFRHAKTGVTLRRTDGNGGQQLAHPGRKHVTISGPAQELLLYAFGRKDHALVEITGDAEVVAAFANTDLSI